MRLLTCTRVAIMPVFAGAILTLLYSPACWAICADFSQFASGGSREDFNRSSGQSVSEAVWNDTNQRSQLLRAACQSRQTQSPDNRVNEMAEERLSGGSYTNAAQAGLRGSHELARAGAAAADTERLNRTSENLHLAGQIGQAGKYSGYAAGAAAIGGTALNHMNKKDPNDTVVAVADVAAGASLAVGAATLATGAYGYFAARDFRRVGLAKARELEAANAGSQQQAAAARNSRAHFEEAQRKAAEGTQDLLIHGAANVAIGGAAMALRTDAKKQKESLKSLTEESPSAEQTANGPNAANTNATFRARESGSANAAPAATAGSAISYGNETNAPNTANEAASAGLIGGINSSASRAPGSSRGQAALQSNEAGAGGSFSGSSESGAGGISGEDAASETAAATEEIAVADPLAEVAYSPHGRGIAGASSSEDEKNPIASVFGQLGDMIPKKGGPNKAESRGFIANASGLHEGSSIQPSELSPDDNLFEAVKKKLFLMKFRGNL